MAFAEALSDDGSLTGRGSPVIRGLVTGGMTAIGGLGHTLPYLIPHFELATAVSIAVVAVELAAISWIRTHYMDTPFLQAAFQVVVGGVLVFIAGILIGSCVIFWRHGLRLAHLSDPHLAPLPDPHWSELINKRVTGYFNWRRTRRFVHDASVLAAIVADLKAHRPDHIAVTGDLANIALAQEFVRGRAWLQALGSPQQVSFVPGNHDAYVRAGMGYAIRQWGDYMCGDHEAADFPYLRRRGPLALIGLSTAVPTAPFMATGRLGADAARAACRDARRAHGRAPVPRGADPSPAGERGETA